MPKEVISDIQLEQAVNGIRAGETVATLARDLEVGYNTLHARLVSVGAITPKKRSDSYQVQLVFHAPCPVCREVIETVQSGEGSKGFPLWMRAARTHARTHGIRGERAEVWADALWFKSGERGERPRPVED